MESATVKPKRKILQTIIASIFIIAIVLWVAGAIVTELSVNRDLPNNTPESKNPSAIVQEVGYDLLHPLGFIKNIQNNPIEPDVSVPSTYTENVNQANQAALNQLVDKKYSATDNLPPDASFTISETLFQATNNGTTVSDSQLSSLLDSAVKPFDKSTLTADVSLLFPIGNPGDQIITVDKVANPLGGYNIDGVIGPGEFASWETVMTIPNKGTELVMPLNAKVYRIAPPRTNNKNYYTDATLVSFNGSDGINYELTISEKRVNSVFPALANAPEIGNNGAYVPFSSDVGIEGETQPAGTPIIKTINNNSTISFTLRCDKVLAHPDFKFISSEGKLIYIP
jgi:archaellum component FlaF (FlaF/FlaG flagellin family)